MNKSAHETRIKVPFGDIDWLGHVNNARYVTYFETARAELLHKTFGRTLGGRWLSLIIARVEIDYLSPARWNEMLLVKVRPISVGNSSWIYEYEIESEDEKGEPAGKRLVARGKSVQVAYDYEKRKPFPIPEDARALLLEEITETKD